MPLNAKLWIVSPDGAVPDPLFVDPSNVSVPSEVNAVGLADGTTLLVVTPRQLLEPSTTYRVAPLGFQPEVSFTTGTATDESPPPVPVETSKRWTSQAGSGACPGDCQPSEFWRTMIESESAAIVVADADEGGSLDPVAFSGAIAVAVGVVDGNSLVRLGKFECDPANWNPDVPPGSLRYGAFDLAGNFSGWSEPSSVGVNGGCKAGHGTDAWPQCFALLLLWRRSRS